MSFLQDLVKPRRVQKLRTAYKTTQGFDLARRYKKFAVGILVFVAVSIVITITLVLLLIRWLWNVGTDTFSNNQPTSSLVASTKESIQSALPQVPINTQDFLQNGIVNEAKITETFQSIPQDAQAAWKAALESAIAQQIESATGSAKEQLQQLQNSVLAL